MQAGLPEGIFVVASPARADLMRALISGPPGTPYQDAVFVFDVQLPPEFPQQPPLVHYLSYGQRINPNLYENGKVCLSLLGTWTGHQSCELWNPETSTVLQVLVSIQALVLCEMPYFNEAGYDKQLGTAEGAYHARRYNEGALLLTIKAMLTSLQHLSPPFERLTRLHFRTVRSRILGRLKTLLELKPSDDEPPPPPGAAPTPPPPAAPMTAALRSSDAAASAGQASTAGAPAASNDTAAAGTRSGKGTGAGGAGGKAVAARSGPVAEAELGGVLNDMPSLGFLHSLHRQLPLLVSAFEAIEILEEDAPPLVATKEQEE